MRLLTAALFVALAAVPSMAAPNIKFGDLYWSNYNAQPAKQIPIEERLRAFREEDKYLAIYSEHRPPWPITLPIKWNANPYNDSNWRYQLNAWRLFEPSLVTYENTRDPTLIKEILPIIEDWYRYNVLDNGVNTYKWYDASAGIRAMQLAYLLTIEKRDGIKYADSTREILAHLTKLHVERLTNPRLIVSNNHAFFQLHGAMALCLAAPSTAGCDKADEQIPQLFTAMVEQQFGTEGMHKEHSPWYHLFVYELVQGLMKSGWYEDRTDLMALMDKAIGNAAWLVDANNDVIEVGDSSPVLPAIEIPELTSGADDCNRITRYDPACFGAKLFKEAGFAIARSLRSVPPRESSLLFFSGGYHSKAHRHADDLAIVWMEDGRWILSDTGRFTYGAGEQRKFTRSTRAHSTIEIDNTSASIEPKFAYGSAIRENRQTDWGFDMLGHVGHRDLKASHSRRVLYRPREWLVIIDRVTDDGTNERNWTSWFHIDTGIEVEVSPDSARMLRLQNGKTLRLRQASNFSNCTNSTIVGQSSPFLQGWRANDFRNLIPRPSIGYSCVGQEGIFVSVFSFDDSAIKRSDDVFTISIGAGWKIQARSATSVSIDHIRTQ